MPFKVMRDDDLNITRIEYWGRIEIDALVDSQLQLLELPGHNAVNLVTYLPDSQLDISADDIRGLAIRGVNERPQDWDTGRTAIIVPGPMANGVSRMYMAYAEEMPTKIKFFGTETDAVEWLAGDLDGIENDQD